MSNFSGFSPMTLTFLQNIYIQNSKSWFDEHRAIYDNQLVKPFRALVEDLTSDMLKIDDWFETKSAIGKTISRINRDTRFSNDKSLYRDRFWLTFKRPNKDWKEAPAYFFEISPHMYRYGLGYYCAPKSTMDIFRDEILQDIDKFRQVVSCVKKPFELVGDSYKRSLNKDLSEDILTWYNRKSFAVMVTSEKVDHLFSQDLTKILRKGFKQLVPLYDYLMRIEMIKTIPTL